MVQQTMHQDWQEKVKLNHVWKEQFDQYGQHPELKQIEIIIRIRINVRSKMLIMEE